MSNEQEKAKIKKEKEELKFFIKGLYSCLKNAELYSADHPTFNQACEIFSTHANQILQSKLEISLSHSDGIYIIGDDFFIEESITFFRLLNSMEEKKIAAVVFNSGMTLEEIKKLVLFLKEEGHKFQTDHIRTQTEDKSEKYLDLKQNKQKRAQKLQEIDKEWIERSSKIFNEIIDEQKFNMGILSDPLSRLIDSIHLDPETYGLILFKPRQNLHIEHSVHSMYFSIFLGLRLGMDLNTCKSLAVAALVHDFGRFLLPAEFKTGYTLSEEDYAFIHLHVQDGPSYLAGVEGLPVTAIRSAMEHHIGYDGQGYPNLGPDHKPHIFSHIISLADFLSWGTVSETEYHKPVKVHRLIRTILHRAGTQFHPLLVKLLIPMFGLYPSGTQIKLTSGEEAISLEPYIRNILRPGVAVSSPNGQYHYRKLTSFQETNPNLFSYNVHHTQGHKINIGSLLGMVPDRTEHPL